MKHSKRIAVVVLLVFSLLEASPFVQLKPVRAYSFSGSTSSVASGFKGVNGTNFFTGVVADVAVATGPKHVVEMVNHARAIYLKNGTLLQITNLNNTFNTGSDFLSDPSVLYDAPSGRWFASIVDTTVNKVILAVSNSSDPTGQWKSYGNLIVENSLPDQPVIGANDDKLVVSANMGSSVDLGAKIWVINKRDLTSWSSSPRFSAFGPISGLGSVRPVRPASSTTTEYMVSVNNEDFGSNSTYVKLFSITGVPGVGGGPSMSNQTLQLPPGRAIFNPPSATQPGCCGHPTPLPLNLTDFRVQDAAWYKGKLWFGLADRCIPAGDSTVRSCVRLIQISTAASTILQEFDYGAANKYYFFPALRIDALGNLGLIYGYSSLSIYPSLAVSGQAVNDPLNSMIPPTVVVAGTSTYNADDRYGDYFGAAVDPSDPTVLWVAGEYQDRAVGRSCTNSTYCWSTFITHMRMRPSITVNSTSTFLGYTVTTNGTLSVSAPLNNFTVSGTLSVSATNNSGLAFQKTYTITNVLARNSTAGPPQPPYDAKLVLNVGVNSFPGYSVQCPLSSNIDITFDGTSISLGVDTSITRNLDVNHDGSVGNDDLTIVGNAMGSNGCSQGKPCYDPRDDVDANGIINTVDLATVALYARNSTDYI